MIDAFFYSDMQQRDRRRDINLVFSTVLSKYINTETIMKRSIIAVSALLVGLSAPALANDNLSKIDQIGLNSSATVEQTGTGNMNTATVMQGALPTQNGNSITMIQTGDNNDNLSTVFQYGSGHSAAITQDGSDTISTSVLTQAGGDNDATVHQGGTGNLNDSLVQIQAGGGNTLMVDQSGDGADNDSFVSAFANSGDISVTQGGTGSTNVSDVHSGIAPNLAVSSSVTVTQN